MPSSSGGNDSVEEDGTDEEDEEDSRCACVVRHAEVRLCLVHPDLRHSSSPAHNTCSALLESDSVDQKLNQTVWITTAWITTILSCTRVPSLQC